MMVKDDLNSGISSAHFSTKIRRFCDNFDFDYRNLCAEKRNKDTNVFAGMN